MKCIRAVPEFNIGQKVAYIDHHNRWQTGRVKSIEARWYPWSRDGEPHISYDIEHPTYRNRIIHTNAECGKIKQYEG